MELVCFDERDETSINSSYRRIVHKDLHYDLDYLKIFSRFNGSSILYARYGDDSDHMMMPYFKRPVNGHFDLISPWYFGGPVFTTLDRKKQVELYRGFRREFRQECLDRSVICEFTRFNPLIGNCFPEVDGELVDCLGRSVVIDLARDISDVKGDFKSRVRKNVNSGRNKGLEVEISTERSLFPIFKEIYLKTMRDIGASEYYFFNDAFFDDLLETFSREMIMYFVKWDGIRISATIDIGRHGTMHDFLRGTYREFLKLNPSYLLMERMIEEAHTRDFRLFSIGGGRTGRENDPLLFFKSSFSNDLRPFCVLREIYDRKVYDQLCVENKVSVCNYHKAEFFPEYRAK